MAEEIKNLIEKIQEEGIKAAEDKAKEIELEAKRKAEEILKKAQTEAEKILSEASEKVSRLEQSAKISINQAGRDLILSLKEEIDVMLQRLIQSSISQALSPQEMAKILVDLIKKLGSHDKEDVLVLLKKDDLEKLQKEYLDRIKEETKKGIILRPSQDITGGFIISFDSGKSHFDFTDKALTEYLGSFIKPHLREILNNTKKD
jgi:V/A-type H+-transporting ATPase subunit E